MDRAQYLAKLLQFAASSPKVNDERRAEYLSRLVHLASKLPSLDQGIAAATEDIAREARILRENARDILWRVAGATLEKRRSLNASGRDVLRILERTPDLLSPLGYARTEVAHSAALAFFLDPSRTGAVGKAWTSRRSSGRYVKAVAEWAGEVRRTLGRVPLGVVRLAPARRQWQEQTDYATSGRVRRREQAHAKLQDPPDTRCVVCCE